MFNVTGFFADNFRTFYQSCGNCHNQAQRNVSIQNTVALNGRRIGIVCFSDTLIRVPRVILLTLMLRSLDQPKLRRRVSSEGFPDRERDLHR